MARLTPTLAQSPVAMRNDGTLSLGSAPTVGNLMVLCLAGWATNMGQFSNHFAGQYRPTSGWDFVGYYEFDINNAVSCWTRRVRSGDTGSITLNAQDNHSAIIYEYEDAVGAYALGGGRMTSDFSGTSFTAGVPRSPFGQNDPVICAFTSDDVPVWTLDAETGLVVDYTSPASAFNHPGAFATSLPTHDKIVTGSLSGTPLGPTSGFFAVVGDFG